jgi:glycosyltransferase involved in cell wall biosynthesis
VCPVSELAGVARHILDVARVGLPGWRLAVAAPEGPLLQRLRQAGVEVLPLPGESGTVIANVAALRRVLRRLRPTIAHSHLARADILLAAAALRLPVTLVTTEHHISPDRLMFHPSWPSAITMELVHRSRLTRFAGAIAVSESTKRDMVARWHPTLPIEVILNGVDRPHEPLDRAPGMRMLSLSRLSPEKNVAMTLRVFRLIRDERPDARLTIAGTGAEESALRALAVDLRVADDVDFVGFVDAARAIETHDVLLQPSLSDNCSYALLDAVAHRMGVAASPIGGNPEILAPQCIADVKDDIGMARVAVEQGRDLTMRPHLPDRVPTVRQMADRIVEVYQSALSRRAEGAKAAA